MCSGIMLKMHQYTIHIDWNDLDSSPKKCFLFSPWIIERQGFNYYFAALTLLGSAVYSKSCGKRAFFRECVFVGCVFIRSIIREVIQSFQAHINYFCSSVSLTEMQRNTSSFQTINLVEFRQLPYLLNQESSTRSEIVGIFPKCITQTLHHL